MVFGYVLLGIVISFLLAAYMMWQYSPGRQRVIAMMTNAILIIALTAAVLYYLPAASTAALTISFTILVFWNIMSLKNFVHLKVENV